MSLINLIALVTGAFVTILMVAWVYLSYDAHERLVNIIGWSCAIIALPLMYALSWSFDQYGQSAPISVDTCVWFGAFPALIAFLGIALKGLCFIDNHRRIGPA